MSKLKISVLTSIFPVATDPYRGLAVFQKVRFLSELAEVQIVCPQATYPRHRLLQPRTFQYAVQDQENSYHGLAVDYVRCPALPLLSRPLNGYLYHRAAHRAIARFQPDVVLSYFVYPDGYAAGLSARKLGVPYVVAALGSD